MSLWDELAKMLEPHFAIMSVAFPDKTMDRNAHIEKWAQFIEQALAAERAATVEECANLAGFGDVDEAPLAESVKNTDPLDCEAITRAQVHSAILLLPYDRSALDDALAQARREQRVTDWQNAIALAEAHPDLTRNELVCALRDEWAAAIRAQED